jgi:hypothetical protein
MLRADLSISSDGAGMTRRTAWLALVIRFAPPVALLGFGLYAFGADALRGL